MRAPVAGLLLCLLTAAAAVGQHNHRTETNGPLGTAETQPRDSSDFDRMMATAMARMHDEMAVAPEADPDRSFLKMMIPHHAGAVEMARLVLIYGKDPLVRQLAEEIIAGQQSEIQAMRRRLDILQAGPDPQPGGFPSLAGTRGE